MILLAGVGAQAVFRVMPGPLAKTAAATVLLAGAAHLGWQAYRLSFDPRLIADPRNPYVYAHTPPGLPRLTEQLERLRRQMPEGRELMIHVVVMENYWPLPWYLRKFRPGTVGYWLDAAEWQSALRHPSDPDVVIISWDFDSPEIQARLKDYNGQHFDSLRPGSPVHVYVRDNLWAAFLRAGELP
jgi:hypothetical protein